MQQKSNAELVALLSAHDENEYTREAFEAMRNVLHVRGVSPTDRPLPPPPTAQPPAISAAVLPSTPLIQITPRLKKLLIAFTFLPASSFVIMLIMVLTQPAGSDASGQIGALIFGVVTAAMAYAWHLKVSPTTAGLSDKRLVKFLLYSVALIYITPAIIGLGAIVLFTILQLVQNTSAYCPHLDQRIPLAREDAPAGAGRVDRAAVASSAGYCVRHHPFRLLTPAAPVAGIADPGALRTHPTRHRQFRLRSFRGLSPLSCSTLLLQDITFLDTTLSRKNQLVVFFNLNPYCNF